MDPREFSRTAATASIVLPQIPAFGLSLAIEIGDPLALWSAAFAEGMSAPGATVEDVIDTIGPREDPVLPDCLAMLLRPFTPPGCAIGHCAIEPIGAKGDMVAMQDVVGAVQHMAWQHVQR